MKYMFEGLATAMYVWVSIVGLVVLGIGIAIGVLLS